MTVPTASSSSATSVAVARIASVNATRALRGIDGSDSAGTDRNDSTCLGWLVYAQPAQCPVYVGRFPGDAPESNKTEKCTRWLRRGNQELDDPLAAFGRLVAEMDAKVDPRQPFPWEPQETPP